MAAIVGQRSKIGWRFWVYWMLATIGGAALFAIALLPLNAIIAPASRAEASLSFAVTAVSSALLGAFFGLGQWVVLRRYIARSGGWIFATWVGYSMPLLAGRLYAGGPPALGPAIMGLEFGLGLGVLQWLVLRTRVYQAGWWIPISVAGWLLAFILTGAAYLSGMYIEPMDMLLK